MRKNLLNRSISMMFASPISGGYLVAGQLKEPERRGSCTMTVFDIKSLLIDNAFNPAIYTELSGLRSNGIIAIIAKDINGVYSHFNHHKARGINSDKTPRLSLTHQTTRQMTSEEVLVTLTVTIKAITTLYEPK